MGPSAPIDSRKPNRVRSSSSAAADSACCASGCAAGHGEGADMQAAVLCAVRTRQLSAVARGTAPESESAISVSRAA